MSIHRKFIAATLAALLISAALVSCTPGGAGDITTPADGNQTQDAPTDVIDNTDSQTDAPGPDATDTDATNTDAPSTTTPPVTTSPPVTTAPGSSAESITGKVVFVSSNGYSDYVIVYPSNASSKVKYAAEELASYLNAAFPGANIKASIDKGKASASEYEILVGKVDRTDVPTLTSGKSDYIIKVSGKKLVLSGVDDFCTSSAIEYFKYQFTNDIRVAVPTTYSYTCASSPRVTAQTPEKFYYYENVYTPSLTFSYACSPGINKDQSKLIIGGVDYTSKATWTAGTVSLNKQTFAAGTYDIHLILTDTDGDTAVYYSAFSCGDGSVLNLYSGELHSHTAQSDGEGTVEQAYRHARDVAGLDFFSVTDHSNSITLATYRSVHIPVADSLNDPGNFVTLYGYEQTYNFSSGYYGHLNVINYGSTTTRSQSLDAFYELMAKQSNVALMFNHPGYKWGNFLEYSLYSAEVDEVLNLSEIKNAGYDAEYALSLTKGWHVSPMYNEDNHTAAWGSSVEACSYALATALTRENIMEAISKNRTYTTSDKSLKIYYKINDQWMGSRLDNPTTLKVSISLSTQKAAGLGTIYLVGEDNIVVASYNAKTAKSYNWEFEIEPLYDYYYIKISTSSSWCITAPIWIENREELSITDLDFSVITDNPGVDDYYMRTTIKNSSSKTMTNITVDYYLSTENGFSLTSTPYTTVSYGSLAAGKSAIVAAGIKYSVLLSRVTAVVTGYIDGVKYCATSYLKLSNLYITEVLPISKNTGGITDPYEYIELYNNSDTAINLSSYSIRYYVKAGASAADLTSNTWKLSGTIAPFSTMVIWIKSSAANTATVDDFNICYRTNLELNKDIVIISGINIPSSNAVQFELMSGSNVIECVWYNWANEMSVSIDLGVQYSYPKTYTSTAKLETIMTKPSPGSVPSAYVPLKIKLADAK